MARPTGKQRRVNQAAAAKLRKENAEKRKKEQNERIAANATGRSKAAQTKRSARLKIKEKETKPKRRTIMTNAQKIKKYGSVKRG